MKISVFKITYHTILEATEDSKDGLIKKGSELSRTSPETVIVAASTLDNAVSTLPKASQPGRKNVVIQSQVLQRDINFNEAPAPAPAAKQTAPPPKVEPNQGPPGQKPS
jgi:hypothetical protein